MMKRVTQLPLSLHQPRAPNSKGLKDHSRKAHKNRDHLVKDQNQVMVFLDRDLDKVKVLLDGDLNKVKVPLDRDLNKVKVLLDRDLNKVKLLLDRDQNKVKFLLDSKHPNQDKNNQVQVLNRVLSSRRVPLHHRELFQSSRANLVLVRLEDQPRVQVLLVSKELGNLVVFFVHCVIPLR